MTRRRGVLLVLGLAVGGLFLWLALREVEIPEVARSLREAELWLAVPFFLSLALFYWLKAVRWSMLLSPSAALEARQLLPSMMVGFAGNNILPVRLGELLRIYLLSRERALPPSMVFATVALERLFDALALLVIVALAIAFGNIRSSELTVAGYALLAAAAAATVLVAAIVVSPRWLSRLARAAARPFPTAWRPAIERQFASVRAGFASIRSTPLILRVMANSLVQWLLMASCIYLAMLAFEVGITPLAAVVILALVVIGISLPNAPAFIGTIEYCFVVGLGLFAVDPTTALSVAIFYHALSFAFVTLSGACFIRRYGTSWRDLQKNAGELRNAGS